MPADVSVELTKYSATFVSDLWAERYWIDHKPLKTFEFKEKETFKKAARSGIPDNLKILAYSKILCLDFVLPFEKNFQQGIFYVEHILCILAHDFPQLEYCPFVPALSAMLSHHFPNPDDILAAMTVILRSTFNTLPTDHDSPREEAWTYFPFSRTDTIRMGKAFGHLLSKLAPKVHIHLKSISTKDIDPVWLDWLCDLFIQQLPQPLLWRLLDSFLIEGWKTLFKFGIAICQFNASIISSCENLIDLSKRLVPSCIQPNHYSSFMKLVWSINFSRSDLAKPKSSDSSQEALSPSFQYIRSTPKMMSESQIMKDFHWIALWSWIPPPRRLQQIKLIFTTAEHGYSLKTLYDMTRDSKPLLILIKTLDQSLFGSYLSDSWPLDDTGTSSFFGTGETFVFTLEPFAKMYPWVDRHELDDSTLPILTRPDTYMFILSNRKELIVGGGGEHALYLNDTLTSGTTGPCFTFGNEPLTGTKEKHFECAVVEVFGFDN